MRASRVGGAVLVLALWTAPLEARVHAPRVVSPHNADGYSLRTFAEFPRWRNMSGDERAWEVFQYLADRHTGLFPLGMPIREGRDVVSEFQQVRDPVKLINVYGYGYCGILGPTAAGVFEGMGLGRSRTLVLPGWHHVVGETFYDGAWHYLDLDVRAAFRRPDGRLASMAEAQRDDSLWQGGNAPLFFPLDPLDQVRRVYRDTAVHCYNGHHYHGHTMDYVLRQGEVFTRWWRPQGGRWNHSAEYHKDAFFKSLFEREPQGPKCKHAGWTVHTHGNGRFVYRPDLTSRSTDFEDGVYDRENVAPAEQGLALIRPGRGFAVFEVRSPYVIVPRVGDMTTTADDCEASVVTLDAMGVTLAISLDNGLTWTELSGAAGEHDLTAWVSGRYGYLLKFSLAGPAAVVRRLEITTWVQVAPASLPSLRRGKNHMEFRAGDHYGLPSRVVQITSNGSDRGEFGRYLEEPPADFDPERKTARARGLLVVRVPAPPGARIAWFSAGGSFNTHQGDAARQTRNTMEYALEKPDKFHLFYASDVPADQAHWHYNADREVKLDTPARNLFVRYTGDPGVNNYRIYAHCLDDRPSAASPVTITHAWTEDGRLKTKSVTLEKPGTYEIEAEGEPVDESIELSGPSRHRE
jgi:hypothetical protein